MFEENWALFLIEMTSSERLFWIGIAMIAAAIPIAVITCVIFIMTGRKLRNQLEEEYGKQEQK